MKAILRENFSKNFNKKLRLNKQIPAVIYGKNKKNTHIIIDSAEPNKLYKEGKLISATFNIEINNKEKIQVFVRQIQCHPVNSTIEHIDFQYALDEKIKTRIPIYFVNSNLSPGIKRGGILQMINRDILLICNGTKIPKEIEIDISTMKIGEIIREKDINLPNNTQIIPGKKNLIIAQIIGKGKSKQEAAAEAEQKSTEGTTESTVTKK